MFYFLFLPRKFLPVKFFALEEKEAFPTREKFWLPFFCLLLYFIVCLQCLNFSFISHPLLVDTAK